MGTAKLDIWFRDERCRPIYNLEPRPRYDWVEIYNCMGELVGNRIIIPPNEAHVRVEVPPGCYKVKGHVCEHRLDLNEATDTAIAIVQCGQEQCVDLICPTIKTCVTNGIHPIVRAALTIPGITREDIRITTRTLLAAAKLSAKEVAQEIEIKRDVVKDLKDAQKEVIPAYTATLEMLSNLDVKSLK
jgi:hypothetical protein